MEQSSTTLNASQQTITLAANVQQGRPIEVLRTGDFVDGNGRDLTITADDLDAFVQNFKTGAAGQEIPIDIDHEMAQAAGWLLSMERVNDILTALPEWNELGKELVGKKIYRYISATIDMTNRIILTISLVNLPAVKGLKPVELSDPLTAVHPQNGDAPDERIRIYTLFQETHMSNTVVATDVAQDTTASNVAAANATNAEQSQQNTQAADATTQVVALSQPVVEAMRAQMQAEMTKFTAALNKELAELGQQRTALLAETVAQLREEQQVTELSMNLTSSGKNSLPVTPGELQAILLSIPKPHRESVVNLLKSIKANGLVDFGETGTSEGKKPTGKTLDANMLSALEAYKKVGGTVEQFFTLNADILGSMDEYTL